MSETTMSLIDMLASDDPRKFPFAQLEDYEHSFSIDGGESEEDIVEMFLACSGADRGDLRVEWVEQENCNLLSKDGRRFLLSWGEEASCNDKTVRALQALYSRQYQIRLVTPSIDTGSYDFVVLSPESWRDLEAESPLVSTWFMPIEMFPDLFHTPLGELYRIGNLPAEG